MRRKMKRRRSVNDLVLSLESNDQLDTIGKRGRVRVRIRRGATQTSIQACVCTKVCVVSIRIVTSFTELYCCRRGRVTVAEEAALAQDTEEALKRKEEEAEERRKQSHNLVAESIRRELAESTSLTSHPSCIMLLQYVHINRGERSRSPRRRRHRRPRPRRRVRSLATARTRTHKTRQGGRAATRARARGDRATESVAGGAEAEGGSGEGGEDEGGEAEGAAEVFAEVLA